MAALGWASGTTQIVDAKVETVTERGFILRVGNDLLTVEDTPSSHFWRSKSAAKREAFKPEDLVTARIRTNVDPPELRELADRPTWQWLDKVRKEPQLGTIERVDDRTVTAKLQDGSEFCYRATEKTKVSLSGRADARVTDLEPGLKVYLKGRTLASLDTWLAEVTDKPLAPKASKTSKKSSRKAKPLALASRGSIEVVVSGHFPQYRMIDVTMQLATLHVTYTEQTKFYLNGKRATAAAVHSMLKGTITYSRDKYGRIIASKVELFGA